ncbi:hypothetical protein GTQ43_09755 [Nostoc sp. KVJ3]|uniref:hypothetical protein n=1 Tax=Nostoc sp. KVJ3 TaxID=457945 RepID=UPI002237A843|nr:hypothetical protein [Nostoc sp. KVJ3]MCW5314077.1 hypothetical protein [Nostoc sp. KVJ3]
MRLKVEVERREWVRRKRDEGDKGDEGAGEAGEAGEAGGERIKNKELRPNAQ